MGIAEIVINSCRLIIIIASRFEPWLPLDISYALDPIRYSALYAYFFIVFIVAVERTLATLMLETYEDITKLQFLLAIIALPWIFGSGVECLIALKIVKKNRQIYISRKNSNTEQLSTGY
uniref:Uncharacterized protein n=1 Tax=Acrobeloides nanus TaxID=290746 RepID=A0A914D6V9_9BILA